MMTFMIMYQHDDDDEYIDNDDLPTSRSRKSTGAGSPLSLLILEGSSRLR